MNNTMRLICFVLIFSCIYFLNTIRRQQKQLEAQQVMITELVGKVQRLEEKIK